MKCIICEKYTLPTESRKCSDSGYVCYDCLAKTFKTTPNNLFKYRNEIDELMKNNSNELKERIEEISNRQQQKEKEERERQKIIEEERQSRLKEQEELKKNAPKVIVTTGDLHRNYEIIGPIYIQVNNRSNQFNALRSKHVDRLRELENAGQGSGDSVTGWEVLEVLFLNSGSYNGHTNFDDAFFIAVEELKEKAALLGADAVIGMRQDIDLDSTGFQYFYLQMYGTAVKYID